MEAASAVVSLPLAAISALDNIVNSLREMGPDAQVAKWTSSADEMIQRVHMIQKDIPGDAMGHFLEICSVYVARRNAYLERMENGDYQGLWFGSNRRKGRRDAQELVSAAGATAQQASRISSTALLTGSRMLTSEVIYTHNSAESRAMKDIENFVAQGQMRSSQSAPVNHPPPHPNDDVTQPIDDHSAALEDSLLAEDEPTASETLDDDELSKLAQIFARAHQLYPFPQSALPA
ncbi:hypothetical protein CPC08DRAFT_716105 [Agrocybe pediades]|nr:hypothetical protein CPC08DRAFT_716105 [Agrocybe pediades]